MLKIASFVIRPPYAFGWEPDPFSPDDLPFKDCPLDVPAGQTLIDNSQYFKPISNQLSLPSCTANAGVDFWEAVLIKELVRKGMPLAEAQKAVPDLSRLFAWYYGRLYMDPPQNGNINSGCYNRLIMEVIARFGLPKESLWPYDTALSCTRPSITSQREAFQRRSKAFYNLQERGSALVDKVLNALNQVPGVTFGTGLGSEFFDYTGGVIYPPNSVVGRHAMVIVGYDPQKAAFKVRNSWSPGWGLGGYCFMSVDYILWNQTGSFWTAEPKS